MVMHGPLCSLPLLLHPFSSPRQTEAVTLVNRNAGAARVWHTEERVPDSCVLHCRPRASQWGQDTVGQQSV